MMHGEYDIDGICLSMPAVVGADGLETKVPISLDEDEIKALQESAKTLKEVVGTIEW